MRELRFSVTAGESDSAMRETADAASSPIIFSSERRGIAHVSSDGLHASEELLYNIKIYQLRSIKELEGQIKVNLVS